MWKNDQPIQSIFVNILQKPRLVLQSFLTLLSCLWHIQQVCMTVSRSSLWIRSVYETRIVVDTYDGMLLLTRSGQWSILKNYLISSSRRNLILSLWASASGRAWDIALFCAETWILITPEHHACYNSRKTLLCFYFSGMCSGGLGAFVGEMCWEIFGTCLRGVGGILTDIGKVSRG